MIGDVLAGAGLLGAGFAAATAIVAGPSRLRCAAMGTAIVLAPVLILGDQWHSSQIEDLRDSPGQSLALGAAAGFALAVLYALFRRRPEWLALAAIAALPFRIPLHAGGDQANLLIPLYIVIAAGVLLVVLRDWQTAEPAATEPAGPGAWLVRLLALSVVLYTLQVLYSDDFSKGLQNVCFFLVPFSVVFAMLGDFRWDRSLLMTALAVMAAEGVVFSLVGFVEYATRDLLWNGAVMRSNQFHVYFRVNSLFWDPNILGRYLAIVIVLVAASLLWARRQATALALVATAFVLWLGLATTFSQSSYAALVAGLATLAALRWSLRWTIAVCAVGAAAALAIAIAVGGSLSVDLSTDNKVNKETTGRFNLASGGLDLFGDRPLWGYGSGSFSTAFRRHVAKARPPVSESHTEPITVAAEQGIIGLIAYVALLVAAFATLCSGLRGMPGLGRAPPAPWQAGRAAVLAAFIALLVHTMAYAAFFEDPITWVLLAVGCSLAAASDAGRDDSATTGPAPDPVRAPA